MILKLQIAKTNTIADRSSSNNRICNNSYQSTRITSKKAYNILRWTGFSPSLTSGRARPSSTDIAYATYASVASLCSSLTTILPSPLPPPPPSLTATTLPFSSTSSSLSLEEAFAANNLRRWLGPTAERKRWLEARRASSRRGGPAAEKESGWERSKRSPAAKDMCTAAGSLGGPKCVPGRMQSGFIPLESSSRASPEMEMEVSVNYVRNS